MSNSPCHSKPYKGPDSYQVEDASLFFGRALDAEQLVSRILSSRITLLHAQSGAGKTSILNAMVIPALEEKNWIPVRVLPQNDPVASAWISVLGYVAPPVRAEYLAVRRIRDELCAPGENPTIGEVLDRYDRLPVRDPRKRSLIASIDSSEIGNTPALIQCANFTPYICRLFRSTCSIESMAEHFEAILAYSESRCVRGKDLTEMTLIGDLLDLCDDTGFSRAYEVLVSTLDAPNPRLRGLLENLVDVYGKRRSQFSLVILFDQFEELFTRFVDLGSLVRDDKAGCPDWRIRYEFFDQLRELYQIEPTAMNTVRDPLPIRYVISMRSEYIAQLDPIRVFAPEIDLSSFRLELLDPEGARQAIRAPAHEYGFGYSDDCYQAIVRELTKEARFVEPAHVQIICEKLWTEQGRSISEETLRSDTSEGLMGEREISVELYRDSLGGATGIMRAFFRDFLDSLHEAERLETLELLEPLITVSGTRNIVEKEALLEAPFRSRTLREDLLGKLVMRTIVRVETRLGGKFVEITHEFLIPPIHDAMQRELYADIDYTRCRVSQRTLGRLKESCSASQAYESLTLVDFDLLNKYRDRLEWDEWGIEIMFRAAVRLGAARDKTRLWADRLRFISGFELPVDGGALNEAAVDIIRKSLDSTDQNERHNAVKALGSISSDKTAEILVSMCLDSTRDVLRDTAMKELVQLGDGINGELASTMDRKLADPDQAKQVYALLGRLRRSGSRIAVTLPRGRAGLRLGMSLFSNLYPKGSRKSWARSMKAVFSGSVLANMIAPIPLMLLAFLILPRKPQDISIALVFALISFLSVACSIFFLPFLPRRASPIALHYSPKLGCAAESLWAAIGGSPAVAVISLCVGGFVTQLNRGVGEFVVVSAFVMLAFSAVLVAVRYGCMRQHLHGRHKASRISRSALGACLGFLLLSITFGIMVLLWNDYFAKPRLTYLITLAATLPGILGLACAYVSIDDEDVIKA